jgi:hypothetical protein
VRFDEVHELVLRGGQLDTHRLAIDLRAIVRQLSADPAPDQGATTPRTMARA